MEWKSLCFVMMNWSLSLEDRDKVLLESKNSKMGLVAVVEVRDRISVDKSMCAREKAVERVRTKAFLARKSFRN